MRVGILGTGMVGNTIGSKLIQLGHEVKMGSRSSESEKAMEWVILNGPRATHGNYEDAARFGEMIFICTAGTGTMEALRIATAENFKGKVVVDVTNPLHFTAGAPPTLFTAGKESLGEQVQNFLEDAYVVKTLNIVNCAVMVNPSLVPGDPDMLLCGNHKQAKDAVIKILQDFGWKNILDLGDIDRSSVMEPVVLLWIEAWQKFQTPYFAIKFVKNENPPQV